MNSIQDDLTTPERNVFPSCLVDPVLCAAGFPPSAAGRGAVLPIVPRDLKPRRPGISMTAPAYHEVLLNISARTRADRLDPAPGGGAVSIQWPV